MINTSVHQTDRGLVVNGELLAAEPGQTRRWKRGDYTIEITEDLRGNRDWRVTGGGGMGFFSCLGLCALGLCLLFGKWPKFM